jgi:amino-acid N-acetyltransferase
MKVRNAKITDAKAIYSLISSYAERDKMLFRSLANIYENLQTFTVAESDGGVIGCGSLQIAWADLAEIKSLAVDQAYMGRGVGKKLVSNIVKQARALGLSQIFALTLTPGFFQKAGFKKVDKNDLPMKVWRDCAKCPKQQNCDEIAVIKHLRTRLKKT